MAEREEFIIPEELLGDGDITIIDSSVEVYERTVDMEVVESETEVDMEVIPDERIMDMEVDHFVVGTPTGGGVFLPRRPILQYQIGRNSQPNLATQLVRLGLMP